MLPAQGLFRETKSNARWVAPVALLQIFGVALAVAHLTPIATTEGI